MRSRSPLTAPLLAFAVPFVAYVLTCSAHAYWLDSGEFVAAAVRLDISHPPGHPLTQLYGKLWSLVPLGSLPWRVAIGQAFATALACTLQCLATAAILRRVPVADGARWACALLGSWLSAFTYGLWFQAVRPEVYALQTLCTAVLLERAISFLSEPEPGPARSRLAFVGPVAIALGLGLANHHFTAVLLLPALLIPLVVLVRAAPREALPKTLGAALGLGLLALGSYAYLPLRAARPLPVNLGHPDDWERFAWVVSARVYTQEVGRDAPQPLAERFADMLVLLIENFGWLPLLAAGLGLYVMLRQRGTRAAGLFLLAVIAPNLLARAWLGPVRSNPDVLGYFGPAFLSIGVLVGCAAGCCLALLCGRERAERDAQAEPGSRWLRVVLALPALALLGLPANLERASLANFTATDLIDDARLRDLPPRSLVVETMPQTVFRHWELAAVERVRPDLVQLPVPFLTHPAMRETLLRDQPSLRPVLDAYLRIDRLSPPELIAEASQRPVWLELDLRAPTTLYPALQPSHLLHALQPRAALDPARVGAELARDYAELYARLGSARTEIETQRQLLAIHYLDAVCLAARGERGLAREEVARALRLAPQDRNVQQLAAALEHEGVFVADAFLQL